MKPRIAFIVCKKWGYDIFKEIQEFQKVRDDFEVPVLVVNKKPGFRYKKSSNKKFKTFEIDPNDQKKIFDILKKNKIEIVCLYSWSYIIRKEILDNFVCLCLHPSLLPKYRGGTPIQNQLVAGEKDSGITIFRMNEKIDAGDIYRQTVMSFMGDVNDILSRMTNLGIIITKDLISDRVNGKLIFQPQDLKNSKIFRRRIPDQSEVHLEIIKNWSFERLNNLVRGLIGPYPNVFIKMKNFVIYVQGLASYANFPQKGMLLKESSSISDIKGKKIFIELKDGYALVNRYKAKKI